MHGFRIAAASAGLLAATAVLPAAAQQMQMNGGAAASPPAASPPVASPGVDLSYATVNKAGAALRQVLQIKQNYSQRMQSANTQGERQQIATQADGEAATAVTRQGLSVDQYNRIIVAAQSNPALKQRVLSAAGVAQ